ncbi:peptidoglycan -binding protein [Roseinatronobacter sp.]|uniref:peptidoglycan -binding protein n=1 Tax=Roseinatronobacter sp. TaxID=1945755 RepID=UPI0025F67405|nr:peptidoglycan -binding protein [Rhodobaca sp.]
MALARRTGQRRDVSGAIWPGFVDAMTALLLVLMFVLSIFMIVQFVLRDTITAQDTQLEGLSAEVASLADALGLSRARVATLEGEVGALSGDLEQARALAAAQMAQISSVTDDLAAREQALDAAQAQLTNFEAQVAALISSRDAAIARGDALSTDLAELEAAQSQLLSEQEAMELALASLREEMDAEAEAARLAAARAEAVEAALAQTQADAASQEATLAQLAAQLSAAEDRVQDQARVEADLRSDLDAAANVALVERAAAEALRARLAGLEAELSAEERRRLADAAAAEALRARLESADAELTSMTLALEEQRRRAEETLTLLAAAREGQAEAEAALEAEISERERLAALRAMAEQTLSEQDAQSLADQRRLEVLNQQVAALRGQVGSLQDLLGDVRAREEAAQTQIESLGSDLNIALAQLAVEQRARANLEAAERERLERFQSEFFGRLREVLEGRDEIQIVGDRFVFSSEVLFQLGSATLAPAGQAQIANVVNILREVSDRIPPEIDWILRVDGHTDDIPLGPGAEWRDNWALSQARALSVVRFMTDQLGFDPRRLAATGFGEYRPVDPADTPEARARNRRIELKLTER